VFSAMVKDGKRQLRNQDDQVSSNMDAALFGFLVRNAIVLEYQVKKVWFVCTSSIFR
jgi:hypothetical protein